MASFSIRSRWHHFPLDHDGIIFSLSLCVCLCVHVCTGLSDPFVELSLLPEEMFSDSSEKQFKTTVQKQTLDPFYHEEFML